MGILIAFEGIDGAGKTTQVNLLGKALESAGVSVLLSKEPTDGVWGRKIRQSATSGRMPLHRELAAFLKDRREHIRDKVAPALEAGKIVILDRYYYSTIAYQGERGADREDLVSRMAEFPKPDVVFLLDADPAVTLNRITNGRCETPNEFERIDKLRCIRDTFNWLASVDPVIVKIDAHQDIPNVFDSIAKTLLGGVLKKYRAKSYDCDCWPGVCSYGVANSCTWANLRGAMMATAWVGERKPTDDEFSYGMALAGVK